jgi:hypothetical protein
MRQTVRSLKLRQMLMASLLFGALAGAFSSSGTFTQTAFSQQYGGSGGQGDCKDQKPDMTTYCAVTWCYYTIAGGPSTATCKYMRIAGTGTCPTNISCRP